MKIKNAKEMNSLLLDYSLELADKN